MFFLRVGRWKTVLVISNSCSAHFLKRNSFAVALPYTFRSNHSFPGLVVCAHSGIEVPEEDEFVCPRWIADQGFRAPCILNIATQILLTVK